jgi:hypothetical protein
MVKFGVEFHDIVYPKWSKIRFKISSEGKFLFISNPSLTPGKLPEGIQKGKIPKGVKIFDYDKEKECIMSLSLNECLQIVDFAKKQNIVDTVDIIHQLNGETKKLSFSWVTGDRGEINLCNITYTKKTNDDNKENAKIYIPVPFSGIREIAAIMNSYINTYAMIRLFCLSEESSSENTYSSKTRQPSKTNPEDWPDKADWNL